MRIIKYGDGWTRRHFMQQVAKGVLAAGVLAPLLEVVGRNGDCAAAYPPDLLSIEAYTKGKLKPGSVLNADNVDLVQDLLAPIAYWQIKNDRRTVDLIATETDVTKLCPAPFIEATLRNKGLHHIGPDGNVWTKDGKPWIGGNPFPEPKTAQELLLANALAGAMYHDVCAMNEREWDTTADGEISYVYDYYWIIYQTVGRVTVEPKPYLPGHEAELRIVSSVITAPQDLFGSAALDLWAYDQHQFPTSHAYLPQTKRVRSTPAYARFDPMMPGTTEFISDAWGVGDPLYTWGDFKILRKGPFLAATSGNCHFGYPNWEVPTCGGKSGKKYFRTFMEMVPEGYLVEMKPTGYPNCPYSRKCLWFDARTGNVPIYWTYDRDGKPFHQDENLCGYAVRKPGMQWPEGMPDRLWSYMNMHMYDFATGRMSRMGWVPKIAGGFVTKFDDPKMYEEFCTLEAIRRFGR
ncbi:MAG: DUF1329 domain-containing protein [Candidatus Binataceae bacterium]